MEAKESVDISPENLRPDAEAVQEILSRHIGDQCQCGGLGVASYGIARYIAKRIQSDLKECQEARDGWCAAFTELRDNPQKPS